MADFRRDEDIKAEYDRHAKDRLVKDDGAVRTFPTGATRSSAADRRDYEGFISPLVTWRFGEFMHKHRRQADGTLRDSDNWQKGMPDQEYVKSLDRHVLDVKLWHRGAVDLMQPPRDIQDALCAVIFNASGLLMQLVRRERELDSQKGIVQR